MTKDLTKGSPLILLTKFVIPLVLGNLFQQLYNLVDAMIVGKSLGLNALSAVGASASVNFLILGFCTGLCVGFAIPTAQQFGAKNYTAMRRFVSGSYKLAIFFSILMTAVTALLCDNILDWMNTPALIRQDAYIYQLIIFFGIPFTILYNTLASIIRAMGDSKMPFYFLMGATIINVGLDLFLIRVIHLGVAGAGIATIASQAISGLCCFIYIKKKYDLLRLSAEDRKLDMYYIKKLLGVGIPMGLQSSITAIGSIMLQTAVNLLGDVEVAGYAAALKIKGIFICPFDGIGSGVATFIGQNLGAGKIDRLRKGVRSGCIIAAVWCVIAFFTLQLGTDRIASLFVDAEETDALALVRQFMHTTSYFYVALAFLLSYRYAIQGMGFSKLAMCAGLLEMIARTCMSLFFIPRFRFNAVVFTDQTAWISGAVFSVIAFYVLLRRFRTPKDSLSKPDILDV